MARNLIQFLMNVMVYHSILESVKPFLSCQEDVRTGHEKQMLLWLNITDVTTFLLGTYQEQHQNRNISRADKKQQYLTPTTTNTK